MINDNFLTHSDHDNWHYQRRHFHHNFSSLLGKVTNMNRFSHRLSQNLYLVSTLSSWLMQNNQIFLNTGDCWWLPAFSPERFLDHMVIIIVKFVKFVCFFDNLTNALFSIPKTVHCLCQYITVDVSQQHCVPKVLASRSPKPDKTRHVLYELTQPQVLSLWDLCEWEKADISYRALWDILLFRF